MLQQRLLMKKGIIKGGGVLEVKSERQKLQVSQARLARLAGVSRYKLGLAEFRAARLTAAELARIRRALRREAVRLRRAVQALKI